LLSVVQLKLAVTTTIHAITFRTKFGYVWFGLTCVPPNNPISACGATSFPGYHSFSKWAMCGFIVQLVKHCTSITEVTGLNQAEALIFFRCLLSNCLNWKIYCDDHSSLSFTTAVAISIISYILCTVCCNANYSVKQIYFLFEILMRKHFWIRINPRFSLPRQNLENSAKTPPFWFHDLVWGEWVQRLLWRLPRKIKYLLSSHFLQDGTIHKLFEKWAETPSRVALGCCSNIPDL